MAPLYQIILLKSNMLISEGGHVFFLSQDVLFNCGWVEVKRRMSHFFKNLT